MAVKPKIWRELIRLMTRLNMAVFAYLGSAVFMMILYPPYNFVTFIEGVFIGMAIMRILIAIIIRIE